MFFTWSGSSGRWTAVCAKYLSTHNLKNTEYSLINLTVCAAIHHRRLRCEVEMKDLQDLLVWRLCCKLCSLCHWGNFSAFAGKVVPAMRVLTTVSDLKSWYWFYLKHWMLLQHIASFSEAFLCSSVMGWVGVVCLTWVGQGIVMTLVSMTSASPVDGWSWRGMGRDRLWF